MSISNEKPEGSGKEEPATKQKSSDKALPGLSSSAKNASDKDMKTSAETAVEELQRDQQEKNNNESH